LYHQWPAVSMVVAPQTPPPRSRRWPKLATQPLPHSHSSRRMTRQAVPRTRYYHQNSITFQEPPDPLPASRKRKAVDIEQCDHGAHGSDFRSLGTNSALSSLISTPTILVLTCHPEKSSSDGLTMCQRMESKMPHSSSTLFHQIKGC
jgi:hypothetical protein